MQWEPRWEDVIIEYAGIRLRVKRDRVTGLYACPLCGLKERATYLFTVKDLVYHIYSHARKAETITVRVEEEREEEGEGEE